MAKIAITTLIATGVAAATLALAAPAIAAPSPSGGSAKDIIAHLQSQGYTVIVTRVGGGPLSACKVVDVRNPTATTRTGRTEPSNTFQTVTLSKTIDLTLNCTAT